MSRINLVTSDRLFLLLQTIRADVHRYHRDDDEVCRYFSLEDFACEDYFSRGIQNKAVVAIVFCLVNSRTLYREIGFIQLSNPQTSDCRNYQVSLDMKNE